MDKDKTAVRITDEAHALLVKKSDNYGVTQKEIASEAILMLVKKEAITEQLKNLKQKHLFDVVELKVLEKKNRDNKFFALGTFLLGTVIGGALIFAILVGVLW